MAKEASKELIMMLKKAYESKKQIEASDDTKSTEGYENRDRSDLGKNDNLFINKEGEGKKPLLTQWRICLFCSYSLTRPVPFNT